MRREMLVVASWLAAVSGCTCPGAVSAVDPASGCCVLTDPRTSWRPCTFTCDAGDCAADQPHALRTALGTEPATLGRRIRATIDLSCDL